MEPDKKKEMLQRAAVIEEECKHFLNTFVNDLSLDLAKKRSETIITQVQRLLIIGHERCTHPHNVQVLAVPVEEVKDIEVPEGMDGKLVIRFFIDRHNGMLMLVTPKEPTDGVVVSMRAPRHTTIDEMAEFGITPQKLITGVLEVMHNTSANDIATQPAVSA